MSAANEAVKALESRRYTLVQDRERMRERVSQAYAGWMTCQANLGEIEAALEDIEAALLALAGQS